MINEAKVAAESGKKANYNFDSEILNTFCS